MSQRDAGYTLLEILVALAVFGLVLAGIGQAFRFGLTAWSGTRSNAGSQDMAAVDMALGGLIAQTLPGSMTGHADGFSFTTRLPEGAGLVGGLADAALLVAPGGNLVLRYVPHPPGVRLGPKPATSTELLASAVDRLTVSYFVRRDGGPPVWSGKWSGDGLPLLIRLHCQSANKADWPDLVVAPVGAGD